MKDQCFVSHPLAKDRLGTEEKGKQKETNEEQQYLYQSEADKLDRCHVRKGVVVRSYLGDHRSSIYATKDTHQYWRRRENMTNIGQFRNKHTTRS